MPTMPNPFSTIENTENHEEQSSDNRGFQLDEARFMRDIEAEPSVNSNWLDQLFDIADDLPEGLPLFLTDPKRRYG